MDKALVLFLNVGQRGASMLKIGSLEHRDAFCRHFTETYTAYDPDTLPWPELDEAALGRLRAVPFWEEVFYTERRAGAIVAAFTETVDDPVLKKALALQGEEESRHARLIRVMIDKYGLDAPERPLEDISDNIDRRFKDFGFGECLDSFLGFGLFKIAYQSEFLPKEMLKIFETLMYEETRHIVFFVNWMAYTEARRGWLARRLLPLTSFHYYMRSLRRMAGLAKRGKDLNDGKNFAATQVSMFLDGFNFRQFLEDCYAENGRRMEAFEPELLRPSFMPQLADVALKALRLWYARSTPASEQAAPR
ncbi:MAG: hypothetical protein IKE60_19775 [Reyranella sp.]|jgi:hypothetical protein|nr:hypothetical protein [Alphaproteobacteria bacterium]MBR2816907.1 hypothetical protein [Reyranella sp.]OJU32664.1 MAG: hypothetical protein BGN99_12625 [Alphaproteobacteria bacterium 65-37]